MYSYAPIQVDTNLATPRWSCSTVVSESRKRMLVLSVNLSFFRAIVGVKPPLFLISGAKRLVDGSYVPKKMSLCRSLMPSSSWSRTSHEALSPSNCMTMVSESPRLFVESDCPNGISPCTFPPTTRPCIVMVVWSQNTCPGTLFCQFTCVLSSPGAKGSR